MPQEIKLTLTVNSVIDNLDDAGLPDGDPEINIFTTEGTLVISERGKKLSFTEEAEGQKTTSTLYITDEIKSRVAKHLIGLDLKGVTLIVLGTIIKKSDSGTVYGIDLLHILGSHKSKLANIIRADRKVCAGIHEQNGIRKRKD